ncbi:formyltransferase family protein [Desulfovibrio sp. JC010]|uniref:formyltransferase family protein n=1 Tax=Desulfovibrio sp. JC010 TaxID=2593641 RepID=UPI0013D4A0A5|nr:formyltransferase family protein [Desulfovibrio sp. JC010]NDV27488.1 hypothetical protein [Desulfovibrio sp. JC010]
MKNSAPSIFLFCSGESLFHPAMYDQLLEQWGGAIVGAAVFPVSGRSGFRNALKLDGPPALPRMAARWARIRAGQLAAGRPWLLSVRRTFKRHNLSVDFFDSPNAGACTALVRRLGVDIVYNNQPIRLGDAILSEPRMGCINRHCSALPQYRGVEPVVRALLNRDRSIGVSIHTMTPEYDCGRIVAQASVEAVPNVFECYERAFAVSVELFDRAVDNLMCAKDLGRVTAGNSPYYGQLTGEEVLLFKKLGLRYI